MLKTPLVVSEQLRVVAPQFVRAQQQLRKIDQAAALADLLVATGTSDHLAPVRIALVVKVLRPQALVFLPVDEILNLAWHPAAVIDLEVLQQALDQPQLVVRVDDLKILRQPGFTPVTAQQPVRKAVKRADPEVIDRHVQQRLDAPAHLGGGLVGKGHREQALRRYALDVDQPGGTVDKHTGLAAAGAGNDQRRLGRRGDGLTLRVVQRFQDRGDVHCGPAALECAALSKRRAPCSATTVPRPHRVSTRSVVCDAGVGRYRSRDTPLRRRDSSAGVMRNVARTSPSS